MQQSVTGNNLNAKDAGTVTCTVRINGHEYTSEPFTLRISGEYLHIVLCNSMYCVLQNVV